MTACPFYRLRPRSRLVAAVGRNTTLMFPVGDVAIKNVADLYLYPNTVRAVRVNGAQVRGWLERSAGMFNQVEAGAQGCNPVEPRIPVLQFRRDGRRYISDRPVAALSLSARKVKRVNPGAARIVNLDL